jgi:transcriptional repressor NrdR
MRCPACGHPDDKVLESRPARDGAAIRRRRACLSCGRRFTTYEEPLRDALMVIKRDGRVEEFSRQKLVDGIARACRKRPVTMEQVEVLVDAVVERIEENYEREVPTGAIGEMVMTVLQNFDEVAYVRFASVYRRFADVQQFLSEINKLNIRHEVD